MLESVTNW